MAKQKDAPDDDDDGDVNKMNEESLGFLEQVRKGKSRYFVLSVKGAKIRSLLVKKKSLKAGDKKEARGGGYEAVFGVATGKGPELIFQIATQDGFTEPPGGGKTVKLKKFLEEQTGKKYKPEYQVVAQLPEISFDEEDLNHPLIAKFLKLEPVIEKAGAARPDEKAAIAERANAIRDNLADERTRDQAGPEVDAFIQYLKELLAAPADSESTGSTPPAAPPPPPPPAPPPPGGVADLVAKLAEGLKKLKPLVEQVLAREPARKGELIASMKQIADEIKTGQVDQARANLVALGTLLKGLLAQAAVAAPATTTDQVAYDRRKQAMQPKLDEATEVAAEKAATLVKVLQLADKQATAGNFNGANQTLDKLDEVVDGILLPLRQFRERWEELLPRLTDAKKRNPDVAPRLDYSYQNALDQANSGRFAEAGTTLDALESAIQQALESAPQTDTERYGIQEGLVAERVGELEKYIAARVSELKAAGEAEIQSVKAVLQDVVPEENPDELERQINDALDGLYASVSDDLKDSLKSGSRDAVLKAVAGWRAQIESDPLVAHLENTRSDLGVATNVADRFDQLFDDVIAEVNRDDASA